MRTGLLILVGVAFIALGYWAYDKFMKKKDAPRVATKEDIEEVITTDTDAVIITTYQDTPLKPIILDPVWMK